MDSGNDDGYQAVSGKSLSILVQQTICGDREAADELTRQVKQTIRKILLERIPDFQEADLDDIENDVVFSVLNNLPTLRNREKVLAWTRAITSNRINEIFRQLRKKRKYITAYANSMIYNNNEITDNNRHWMAIYEDADELKHLSKKLVPQDREVLYLWLQSMTGKEIAEKIGKSEDWVKDSKARIRDIGNNA